MLSNTTITHNMPMTNAVRVIILHWFIIRAALIILALVLRSYVVRYRLRVERPQTRTQ